MKKRPGHAARVPLRQPDGNGRYPALAGQARGDMAWPVLEIPGNCSRLPERPRPRLRCCGRYPPDPLAAWATLRAISLVVALYFSTAVAIVADMPFTRRPISDRAGR